jgi:hypothetical protein
MTQTRKVTPELIERLRREQQNAWGNVTLEDTAVQCRYGEELITIELQIEPEIIMHGQADKLAPGVVYHPEYLRSSTIRALAGHRGSHCLWDKRGARDPRHHRARRRKPRTMVG